MFALAFGLFGVLLVMGVGWCFAVFGHGMIAGMQAYNQAVQEMFTGVPAEPAPECVCVPRGD